MAKVAWVVPSVEVFNNPSGNLVIDSPMSYLNLEVLPNNYSFDVSFGIIGIDEIKTYTLQFELIDPDDKIIFNTTVKIDKKKMDEENGDKKHLNVFETNARFNNLRFEKEGIHSIKLTIEDNTSNAYFNVMKGNLENGERKN
ncbi:MULTISPECIES: DUF6941 family protein [Mammaliicoccus]|uniref:DUF6941 family protein n=1 Tax=Mammaliicoccus TaxID=2803850 RepID=UPI000D1D5811|nr:MULTISPECIES: hypothetical protein [Mammaliicoccus]HAL09008.1 hypothetical protein [Staphylococcus sp.]PTI36352.1 hypothetical protein BU074_10595 [Mammaliicoccus vitulinus]PTI71224.1 hypothetical protein BU073_08675 [Mammaliicoccus vitulinus]PTI85503.1 hypothetical protein BU071_11595 [Mammaliicoccus vitulinus]QQT15915.1 hypothetical protein I6J10_02965 [Mammaliicoccus vitulinus]